MTADETRKNAAKQHQLQQLCNTLNSLIFQSASMTFRSVPLSHGSRYVYVTPLRDLAPMGEVSMSAGGQDIGLAVLACSREPENSVLILWFCFSLAQTPTRIGATNEASLVGDSGSAWFKKLPKGSGGWVLKIC